MIADNLFWIKVIILLLLLKQIIYDENIGCHFLVEMEATYLIGIMNNSAESKLALNAV